ncbi:MAG TPA: sigma-54 dependent transcriptional regulator [Gemmatimonadaceae bacterium]|jgi:DNA-binding NtrC family response regulator
MARNGGATVLITLADVEPAVRLNALLESAGISTSVVSAVDNLSAEIRRTRPELIVLTGNIADPAVRQVVRDQLWEGTAVIGLADVADPQLIERLRSIGFVDVYTKPVVAEELVDVVKRVLERRRLAESTGLVGQSDAIREVLVRVEQMAPVSSTVLIQGESGTGKELVARAIHQLSPRRGRPFIAVNVGALPETLLESELFGHEKGAFTGAAERRIGRFELADTGTLFLDEIGDIPPATQVKLLRVLEEREVTRVGGTIPIKVNVRVVTATNQPLRKLVEEGRFRSDLYYRLNVLSIYLPPLRERRADIPLLVRRFVRQFSAQHDRPFHGIAADAMQIMSDYAWPGNVRQLKNLIESMVVLAPGREITATDIPAEVREGSSLLPVRVPQVAARSAEAGMAGRELEFIVHSLVELRLQLDELRRRVDETAELGGGGGGNRREMEPVEGVRALPVGVGEAVSAIVPESGPPPNVLTVTPGMTMAEIERGAIEAALRETDGNRRRAAELLGIGERTLYRKLKEYDIPDGYATIA